MSNDKLLKTTKRKKYDYSVNHRSQIKNITKLVLGGGGLKGLAYVGAIYELRKLRILDQIEEIVGCSIGSVFGLLILLGYSDEDLHDFLLHFQYDQLKDLDFFKLISEYGIESGSKIEIFLNQLIRRKTGLIDPTFAELYKKVGISLVVNAVALDEFKHYYFGLTETPNMKVVKAIRASISVPGLFTPVKYETHLFVDGGLLNNFPIEYFKNKVIGSAILGLRFDPAIRPPGLENLNGINSFLTSILACILNRVEKAENFRVDSIDQYYLGKKPRIITIATGDITAFQKTLDRTRRLYLYHNGRKAVKEGFEFLSNKAGQSLKQPVKKVNPFRRHSI